MPYPGQFHRLVMIGSHYNDTFNMTLSIVPSALGELGMPEVDAGTLASVAAAVGTWFPKPVNGPGPGFHNISKLTSIKLNRINAAGHYVDPIAREHLYGSPISGSEASNPVPQIAQVITLGTALDRGRGSRGRVYALPNTQMFPLDSSGRASASTVTYSAEAWKILINQINSIYTLIGRVGVASNAGAGRFEHVTRIGVGRAVDTMRSRRSTLVEDHQYVAL